MIAIEKLRNVTKIITHKNTSSMMCADGVASAIILHDALRNVPIEFHVYQSAELATLEAKPGLLFCDITPVRERVADFVAVESIVLDHHKGAEDVVKAFGANGVFADEKTAPGVSGAMLALLEVWEPLRRANPTPWIPGSPSAIDLNEFGRAHWFAKLVGIYDTWQRNAREWPDAENLRAILGFMPPEYWLEHAFPFREDCRSEGWWEDQLKLGKIIREHDLREATSAVHSGAVREFTWGRVRVIEHGKNATTAIDIAKDDLLVAMNHIWIDGPRMKLSLRARGKFDCKEFCKQFGGGGHTNAAGCTINLDTMNHPDHTNPFETVFALIRDFGVTIG